MIHTSDKALVIRPVTSQRLFTRSTAIAGGAVRSLVVLFFLALSLLELDLELCVHVAMTTTCPLLQYVCGHFAFPCNGLLKDDYCARLARNL